MAKKSIPSKSNDSDIINTKRAEQLLGVSRERISQLVKMGYIEKPGRDKYNIVNLVQGYINFLKDDERRGQKVKAQSRVSDARATEIELRTAERQRQLVQLEDATAAMDAVVGTVSSEMKGFPARFTREKKLKARLETSINESLDRIATSLTEASSALGAGGDVLEAVSKSRT